MRSSLKVVVLVCAFASFAESLSYAALAPYLPQLEAEFDLGHELAGLLVACYAVGYFLAAWPGYRLAIGRGVRTAAISGMMIAALGTALFATVEEVPLFFLGRLLMGAGSVVAYTGLLALVGALAGSGSRAAAIGTVYGGSAAGASVGPLVGSLAHELGRDAVFITVALLQVAVALFLLRLPSPSVEGAIPARQILRRLSIPRVRLGLWVACVPGFAIAALSVSGTYRLIEFGAPSLAIAIAFSGIALVNVFLNPAVGRLADRSGYRRSIVLAVSAAGIAVVLLALVRFVPPTVLLITASGALFTVLAGPGLALVGEEVASRGGGPTESPFLLNVVWGPAAALGAIVSGLFHGSLGAEVSFAVLAVLAFGTALEARRRIAPAHTPAVAGAEP